MPILAAYADLLRKHLTGLLCIEGEKLALTLELIVTKECNGLSICDSV